MGRELGGRRGPRSGGGHSISLLFRPLVFHFVALLVDEIVDVFDKRAGQQVDRVVGRGCGPQRALDQGRCFDLALIDLGLGRLALFERNLRGKIKGDRGRVFLFAFDHASNRVLIELQFELVVGHRLDQFGALQHDL